MNDVVEHEVRRNVAIVAAVIIVGLGMVAAMFWVVRSMSVPSVALSSSSVPSASATPRTTSPTPVPATTTTFVPPTPTWVDSTTLNLPPAALPTLTDPVPGQTADPDPNAPTSAPQPAPSSQSPRPTDVALPPATVSNVNLTCSKGGGGKVAATLTFTTTARVAVAISAGGHVDRKQVDPGDATVTTSGKGPAFCAAVVGGQSVGPIPAG